MKEEESFYTFSRLALLPAGRRANDCVMNAKTVDNERILNSGSFVVMVFCANQPTIVIVSQPFSLRNPSLIGSDDDVGFLTLFLLPFEYKFEHLGKCNCLKVNIDLVEYFGPGGNYANE